MSVDATNITHEAAAVATNDVVATEGVATTTQTGGHEPTLYAEPIGELGGLTVTNSLLTSWIAVAVIILVAIITRLRLRAVPRGAWQNTVEVIVEQALTLGDTITGDRHKTMKFFPIAFALFLFILINNWLGLLPGIGSVGFFELHDGHATFIPFFRGGTADLNTTVALALVAVIGSHFAGIWLTGFWHHLNKFLNFKAFAEIPGKIVRDPAIVLVNPIKAFVGLIEIVGEAAKIASLSFRLFGNIFAGEVLLASMAALAAFFLPIPFMFLEIIVGLIQALIFSVLTLVYLTIATSAAEH